MEATVVLQAKNLTKQFSDFIVLNNLSFSLEAGKIYGLIGQNGAGKSTLMRLVTGLSLPNNGSIELFGTKGKSNLQKSRKAIGSMIESPQILPKMSATENLTFHRIMRGIKATNSELELLSLVGLEHTGKKKAKDFSLGMKQKLGIAISLLGNPKFLILDEPINGLDPTGVIELRKLLLDLSRNKKTTILISSHNLPELHNVADDYLILDQGALLQQISALELEEKCEKYIVIETPHLDKLIEVLQKKLQTDNYEIQDQQSLKLYDYLDDREKLATVFLENKLIITIFAVQENTLEQYYISLIGERDHAKSNQV